jgi:Zn-dependent protease with chaperone function
MKDAAPFTNPWRKRLVLACFVSLLFAACATRSRFAVSTVVPAAVGEVKVKKDGNNNYAVNVSVENLAEPNRLPQPKNVYVVWADTPNGVQNLGRLDVDKGFITGKLKASLETVTPYKPSRVFITAEDAATITYPGSYVVLNTNSF